MKISPGINFALLGFLLVVGIGTLQAVGLGFTTTPVAADKTVAPKTIDPYNANSAPVLVELFTSEGCFSCPPADQVLTQLDKERDANGLTIIPLSQHVDYWNQLGWKDPYSSALLSERQSGYAEAFGRNGVYTPQMVVDGRWEFVGSNLAKAHDAIKQASQLRKAKIQIELPPGITKDGEVQASLQIEQVPTISTGDTADVFVVIAEDDLSSSVAAGENSGRKLRHTAVVRQLINVATLSGQNSSTTFTATPTVKLKDDWRRDKLRLVVFIQERKSRYILGAAMSKLTLKT